MSAIPELEARLLEPLSDSQRLSTLNALAWELRRLDPARAMTLAKDAAALAESVFSPVETAYSLATEAAVLHRRGRVEEAIQACEQAIQLTQPVGEKIAYGRALWTQGWIAIHQGEITRALELFVEMHTAAQAVCHLPNEALALNSVGVVYGIMEDVPRAMQAFEASLHLSEQIGDLMMACGLLNNLTSLKNMMHDHEGALELAQRAVTLSRSLQYTYGEYTALINLGHTHSDLQHHAEAVAAYEQALGLVEQGDFISDMKAVLVRLGTAYVHVEQYAAAETTLLRALELAQENGEKPVEMEVYAGLKALYRQQRDFEKALIYTEKQMALEREINSEHNAARFSELEVRYRTQQAEAEAHHQQQRRQQDQQVYQALMQMKDDLIAMTTHDIKSPLTVIMTSLYLLGRMLPDDPKVQRHLQSIERQTVFISQMITDMLDLVYLESGQRVEMVETPISAFVAGVVGQHQAPCEQSGLTLSLVPLTEDVPVSLNHNQFERMLNNLISNARKHTPAGGLIQIRLVAVGDEVEIQVQDTGQGIPEADRAHIFERFYRAHNDREVRDGHSGLGLTIVKTIVENHQGSIRLESEIDQGTTFFLRFPMVVTIATDQAINEQVPVR
ncbi:MAG: hypothetical protein OHK0046_00480 [Anaerolineae bacterium]